MSTTYESRLTRAERLQLAGAVLRGVLTGATRAVISWLLEEHIHHSRHGIELSADRRRRARSPNPA